MDARAIIDLLNLEPHPEEGGWFREIYRSADSVGTPALRDRYGADRVAGTAIYYLLTPDTFSAMHRLKSDEIFHFYLGDPVEQLLLYPDGSSDLRTLGSNLSSGARPVSIVPAGAWQGARLAAGGALALLGCTVSPGFDYADYDHGNAEALIRSHPGRRTLIEALSTA